MGKRQTPVKLRKNTFLQPVNRIVISKEVDGGQITRNEEKREREIRGAISKPYQTTTAGWNGSGGVKDPVQGVHHRKTSI